MSEGVIDVWNVNTFDDVLHGELRLYTQLIRDYMETEVRDHNEYNSARPGTLRPANPYSGGYLWLAEHIMDYMASRTIRAWHYTRLTDDETLLVCQVGVYPSTLATIRARLDARVAAGDFSASIADALFNASPFQHPRQVRARSNLFWMTSHPFEPADGAEELLLGNWGGEGIYFWLQDETLTALVASVGKPRVIEVAVPISATSHRYNAAEAVLATFGRSLGCKPERKAFDLYSTCALGPKAVTAIHTDGESAFKKLARGYPIGFIHDA